MACGPVSGSDGADKAGTDPFSISQETMMAMGVGAMAMFWTTPMRAAFVVADEVMRESMRPWS
ncbi:MAG: hypothetical protein AAFR79_03495 [Pseudomonadota bacterium]